MKTKIYWSSIIFYGLLSSLIALAIMFFMLDPVVAYYLDKIPNPVGIDIVVDTGYWIDESQKVMKIGGAAEAVVIGIVLLAIGAFISKKANQNKLLNAGLCGGLMLIFFNVYFFAARAYVRYKMNKYSSNPRPLIYLNNLWYVMPEILLAFVVAVIGAFLFQHFLRHRNTMKVFSIRSKKSQAALDFIMTYGWAIMMVLVAIGALAYFGVLDSDKIVPRSCNLPPGLACLDHEARSYAPFWAAEIDITLKNSLGYDITSVTVTASGCTSASSTQSLMRNGAQITFTPHDCYFAVGEKYQGEVNITYTNADTGITHTARGSISTKVLSTS